MYTNQYKNMIEKYVVNAKNQKTSIILPLKENNKLMEDLHDLSIIAERKNEPTISFKEVKNRLKKDGLL